MLEYMKRRKEEFLGIYPTRRRHVKNNEGVQKRKFVGSKTTKRIQDKHKRGLHKERKNRIVLIPKGKKWEVLFEKLEEAKEETKDFLIERNQPLPPSGEMF
jgi:virulence-associated protein VagC